MLLLLVSLAFADARQISLNGDTPVFEATCPAMNFCYQDAARMCPQGYETMSTDSGPAVGIRVGSNVVLNSQKKLQFSCKSK